MYVAWFFVTARLLPYGCESTSAAQRSFEKRDRMGC